MPSKSLILARLLDLLLLVPQNAVLRRVSTHARPSAHSDVLDFANYPRAPSVAALTAAVPAIWSWPVAAYGCKTAPLLACGRNDRGVGRNRARTEIAVLDRGEVWLQTQSPHSASARTLERKWRRATVGWRRITTEWQDADKDEDESTIYFTKVGCATR